MGSERGVERQAARAEQPGSLDELGDGVAAARGAELLIDLFLFLRHAHDRPEQILADAVEAGRGVEALSLALEKTPGEQAPLVGARVRQRLEEIVEPRADELDRAAQRSVRGRPRSADCRLRRRQGSREVWT